jgi:hypothetical protein
MRMGALALRAAATAAASSGRSSSAPLSISVSGLMKHRVPFIVTELGADTDPFLLHIYAALGLEAQQAATAKQGRSGRRKSVA